MIREAAITMCSSFENIEKGTAEFPVGIFDKYRYVSYSHFHMEYELFYLAEGNPMVEIGKNSFVMNPGQVLFINPGVEHSIKKQNPSDVFHYYAIVFDASVFGTETETTRKTFEQVLINSQITLSQELLTKIKVTTEKSKKNITGKEIAIKNLIYDIFLYVLNTNQYAPLPGTSGIFPNEKSVDRSISFIQKHFRENIGLKDLLDATQYSKSHFIKLFKNATGMNYTDYLNRFRIEKACRDLIYTSKNVTEVATENGFNNIQYFSKIFKKYMECTPKQYQKKWKVPVR